MAGVNSLGIGSGVLTSDLIDKLRAADDKIIIKPLEDKIVLENQKEDAYKLLSSLMTTFKSSASALDGDTLYLSRAVTGNTSAVTVTAEAGSNVQNFSITDINKAQSDVWNSTAVSSTSTAITNIGTGTLTIGLGGTDYAIDYTATSTLDDIKNAINDKASSAMTASILQVGTSSYELVLTAKDTNKAITYTDSNAAVKQLDTVTLSNNIVAGDTFTWSDGTNSIVLDEALGGLVAGETPLQTGVRIADAINNDPALSALYTATAVDGGFTVEAKTAGTPFTATITSTGAQTSSNTTTTASQVDNNSLLNELGLNNIQTAKGSTFKYNGVAISRDTNNITDLIIGVTINLNQNQATTESASIDIAQNSTSISSEMSLFVNGYNSLMTNLDDMTRSDRTSGSVGIFNSESFVKSIKRELTDLLTRVDTNGNSLMDYGVSIDRKGTMSLDNNVFADKFVTDAKGMELFFSGNSTTDGIFTKLNTKMEEYTGFNKLLSNFSDQLASTKKSVTDQFDLQTASLNNRYAIMTKRFTAYDAIISRLNSNFASLQLLINTSQTKA